MRGAGALLGGGGGVGVRGSRGWAVSSPQTAKSGVIFQQVTCRLQAWSPGLNREPVGGSDREQLRTAWRRPPGAGPALCWAVCGGCLSPAQSSPRRGPCAPFTDRGVGEAVRLVGPSGSRPAGATGTAVLPQRRADGWGGGTMVSGVRDPRGPEMGEGLPL